MAEFGVLLPGWPPGVCVGSAGGSSHDLVAGEFSLKNEMLVI